MAWPIPKRLLVVLILSTYVGACMTINMVINKDADRGIKFNHKQHFEAGLEDCSDCHSTDGERPSFPDHELCGVCHEIDIDNIDPEACGVCHSSEALEIKPYSPILKAELKFKHEFHMTEELNCAVCHADPDTAVLPNKKLKPFCVDCHSTGAKMLTECQTCHSEISKTTRPSYRGETRIAHDEPKIWEHMHGREARFDPQYCTNCHELETYCDDCHRKNPPRTHTVSWRRKSHGLRATWDRDKCATCHEEDSCVRCHNNTQPSSHRQSNWDSFPQLHCVSCHYPAQRSNCTVCHESITHEKARPSIHRLGTYPRNCGRCHPGGRPHAAPHKLNSTVRCRECH